MAKEGGRFLFSLPLISFRRHSQKPAGGPAPLPLPGSCPPAGSLRNELWKCSACDYRQTAQGGVSDGRRT